MPSPATTGSVLLGLLLLPSLHSQDITLEHGSEAPAAGWIALPYVFSSETWDLAFGIAGGIPAGPRTTRPPTPPPRPARTKLGTSPSEEKHPAWNPLASGRTSLLVRPYYRKQDVEIPLIDDPYTFETLNVRIGLEYDNRDFPSNPARGSYQQIALTRDWGALGETDSWTFGEIELGKYFDLGASSVFRQQVIGLNAWTGYSFTWNEIDVPGLAFPVAVNRPPYYTGATLGGLDRMRGYPAALRLGTRGCLRPTTQNKSTSHETSNENKRPVRPRDPCRIRRPAGSNRHGDPRRGLEQQHRRWHELLGQPERHRYRRHR